MKHSQTLRSRIAFYFCTYLTFFLVIYSAAMIGIFKHAEDLTYNRQLSEVANNIAQHVESSGKIPDSLPLHIAAYHGFQNVPRKLQESVINRDASVFEINKGDLNYHAALIPLNSTGQILYVFYDVESVEASERLEWAVKLALLGAGLGVLLLGWILARSLSNRILTPIFELAGAVRSLSLQKENTKLNFYSTPDEVGMLAETIENLLASISEFTRREREFTSHASHELRTPVTIIKGALEIIKSRNNGAYGKINVPLARIDRAVKDIEMLIDTFLFLARKEQVPDKDETCDLQGAVIKAVNSHRYLLKAKPVEVQVETADSGSIQAPASLVNIALGNLVRNAFQYTMRGKIEIIALKDRVIVSDSGPGIDSTRQAAGVGLTIVKRLCERMKWRFVISGSRGEGSRADLIFISSETNAANPAPAPG
jgi:signal transduction histidine kinase